MRLQKKATLGLASVMAIICAAPVTAQEVTTVEIVPVATEAWNVVSRSGTTIYMVNVGDIRKAADVTTTFVARVPAQGESSDLSHSVTQIDFKCSAKQSRPAEEVIYGADGSVEDRINDGYDFDAIPANSLDDYVKALACDNERTQQSYASIQAFIAAGRPSR